MTETVRLTIEVTKPVRDRLGRLKAMSGARSTAEVIRRALASYEALLEAKERGEPILVREADGTERELLIP